MELLGLNTQSEVKSRTTEEVFGQRIGFFARLFGCWHFRLSRPMTIGKESYRVCAKCGARRRFDTETLKNVGSYYYPPQQSLYP